MFTLSAAVEVDAPAAVVWRVVTDFERYAEWNPFVHAVETDGRIGSRVRMRVKLIAGIVMDIVETMTVFDEGRELRTDYRKVEPFLRSYRVQRLTPLGASRCRYETSTSWEGLVTPIARLLYARAVRRGFDALVIALKARAEATARGELHAS